jgi:hypothetical protein
MTPEQRLQWRRVHIQGCCVDAITAWRAGARLAMLRRELAAAQAGRWHRRPRKAGNERLARRRWYLRNSLISALTCGASPEELWRFMLCHLAVADLLPEVRGAAALSVPVAEFRRISAESVREVLAMEPIYERVLPWV